MAEHAEVQVSIRTWDDSSKQKRRLDFAITDTEAPTERSQKRTVVPAGEAVNVIDVIANQFPNTIGYFLVSNLNTTVAHWVDVSYTDSNARGITTRVPGGKSILVPSPDVTDDVSLVANGSAAVTVDLVAIGT